PDPLVLDPVDAVVGGGAGVVGPRRRQGAQQRTLGLVRRPRHGRRGCERRDAVVRGERVPPRVPGRAADQGLAVLPAAGLGDGARGEPMTDQGLVSVVVPISSSDAHPRVVVEALAGALRRGGYACEFVLVLDGPVGAVEREIETIDPRCTVKVVRLQGGGLGESIALSAGVGRSSGKLIVNVPPYLQTEAEDVLQVLAALEAGADCVATSRTPRVDPWLNQLQSRLFNNLLRFVMGMPFHDLNSGTRGFRRQVLEEVSVYGDLYRFLPVLALRQGFRVVEVKVRHREEKGRSG